MAKRGRPRAAGDVDGAGIRQPEQETGAAATRAGGVATGGKEQDVLGDFAADLGRFLGGVQSRATTWLDQRKAIADQLTQIRDTASQYLRQLSGTPEKGGDQVPFPNRGKRRGRPPSGAAKRAKAPQTATSGRKRRTMSAAARKRISDAQKARWAKQRGE